MKDARSYHDHTMTFTGTVVQEATFTADDHNVELTASLVMNDLTDALTGHIYSVHLHTTRTAFSAPLVGSRGIHLVKPEPKPAPHRVVLYEGSETFRTDSLNRARRAYRLYCRRSARLTR